MRRWLLRLLLIGVVGFCVVVGVSWWSDHAAGDGSLHAGEPTADLVARGAYLAKLGDCAACHSIAGQPEFSGGLRMVTPIGAIYSSNITPDKDHGIGSYTLADFDRALRFGVADGHSLYPAMPFTSYFNTKPEDVAALYAYFQHGVAPAALHNRRNEIPFPLSMRWPLTYWRWFFAPRPEPFVAPQGSDPLLAKGAYFVDGLGHCGECHTPRGAAMQVSARSATDGSDYLAGAVIDNLFAPSLRNDAVGSLANWSEVEVVAFLHHGTNAIGIAFGSMSDVIVHSTQYMTDEDALAAARYLKSIGVSSNPAIRFAYDETSHAKLKHGDASQRGAQLYLDNCAACHRPDGKGYEGVFPSLAGNPIVQAPDSLSLVAIVMDGSTTARTKETPAQFTMPAFAWRLSDLDVADVLTFIRASWGNTAAPVSVPPVESHRAAARVANRPQ
jgi:alcohol dehydrogenase (quinone), cytochrome c subunit